MPDWLAPARRRGVEWLDDPGIPDEIRVRAMADVARSNTLLGGTAASVDAVVRALDGTPGDIVLLDVATGAGDIPPAIAAAWRARHATRVFTIGVDRSPALLARARGRLDAVSAADALALPFADDSVDVVVASQFLHHFEEDGAVRVLREMHRVARRAVVVSDLGRSRLAAGGFWFASHLLRFHPVTRHDGVVSVLRGFTAADLGALIERATRQRPVVTRHRFWRLSAVWRKSAQHGSPGYT